MWTVDTDAVLLRSLAKVDLPKYIKYKECHLGGSYGRIRMLDPQEYTDMWVIHPTSRREVTLGDIPTSCSHVLICTEGTSEFYKATMSGNLEFPHVAHAPVKSKHVLPITPGNSVIHNGQVCMLYFPACLCKHILGTENIPLQSLTWAVETFVRRLAIADRHPCETRMSIRIDLPRTDWIWVDSVAGSPATHTGCGDSDIVFMSNPCLATRDPAISLQKPVFHRNMPPNVSKCHVHVATIVDSVIPSLDSGNMPHIGVLTVLTNPPHTFAENMRECSYPFVTYYVINFSGDPLGLEFQRPNIVIITPPVSKDHVYSYSAWRAVCKEPIVVHMYEDVRYPIHSVFYRVALLVSGKSHGVTTVGCISPELDHMSEHTLDGSTLAYTGAEVGPMKKAATIAESNEIILS